MGMKLSGSLNLTGSLNTSGSINLTGSVVLNQLTYPTADFADGQYGVEVPTLGVNNVFSMEVPKTIYEYVKNDSGVFLAKGTPVHSTGTTGFNTLVIAASASVASTMPATYILAQDLDDEEEGLGIAIGAIQGVNTTGLIAGDPVWVGANGGWTQTKPTGSNLIQNLGIVTKVGVNGGGVVLGAGRSNDVPNIQQGYFWVGNSGSVATATPTSSFALTGSNTFIGNQTISGSLLVTGSLKIQNNDLTISKTAIGAGTVVGNLNFKNDYMGDYVWAQIQAVNGGTHDFSNISFSTTYGFNTLTEKVRITDFGNLNVLTGSIVIGTAGQGINFSADPTGSGTSTSQLLDDYEEGTWTPVIRGDATAGTYELATSYAHYTKIGGQVTLTAQIQLAGSITGGGSGYLQITGAPFTKANNMSFVGATSLVGVDFTGQYVSVKFVSVSPTAVLFLAETVDNGASVDLPISSIAANDQIAFTITYFV